MIEVTTGSLGFGRIGPKRELKFALEKYWKGKSTEEELLKQAQVVEDLAWTIQYDLDKVPVGDFALYDNVLAWAEWLGIIPSRHQKNDRGIDCMFAMARGLPEAPALSMKKWLTSNYHYMVPEVDGSFSSLSPDFSSYIRSIGRGIKKMGTDKATPVVLGPVSLVRFCDYKNGTFMPDQRTILLNQLIPIYKNLLLKLAKLGISEIQIHEPSLVFDDENLLPFFQKVYPEVLPNGVNVNLVSFFEDVGAKNYKWMISVKEFNILSLDFTRGNTLNLMEQYGFPVDKVLGAGIIDGRSVWKMDPKVTSRLIEKLQSFNMKGLRIQPSSNLQFVPWNLECETEVLSHPAGQVLSFSKQKVQEVNDLMLSLSDKKILVPYEESWSNYRAILSADNSVTNRVNALTEEDFYRSESYKVRRDKQLPGLPLLPTTTIGSFPQTKEIRSLRTQLKKGQISQEQYNSGIDQQISFCIGVQEAIGLDIFVHGESERTDMVEFFAKHMNGMLFTQNGWVQSFGSRCVRPPTFWNDISRPNPMSIREFKVAQNLTKKPVKGMLTGPITILNWSFPRIDVSRKTQAYQIALAVRDEIQDLESAGCIVIQVDEPALREAMPLRSNHKQEYLTWAVDAFRLATAGAKPETQIHTHMCYCEFADCMDAIDRMDADCNSIENARSDDATLRAFRDIGYGKGLGPGTYDIHSPVVPPVEFFKSKIQTFLSCIDEKDLVINPDCGLKTRNWDETISALKNMVQARNDVLSKVGA